MKKFFFTVLNTYMKNQKISDFEVTLTLDHYVISIGLDRRFHSEWFDVSMMNSSKVVCVFIEVKKVSGAIYARRGPRTLSIWID